MYVQSIDGNFYLEPVIIKGDIYATFRDVPTLYSTIKKKLYLKNLNLKGNIDRSTEQRSVGTFPPSWDEAHVIYTVEFALHEPIPTPDLFKGCFKDVNYPDETIIFSYEFPKDTILRGLKGNSGFLLSRFAGSKPMLLAKLKKHGYNWRQLPELVKLEM